MQIIILPRAYSLCFPLPGRIILFSVLCSKDLVGYRRNHLLLSCTCAKDLPNRLRLIFSGDVISLHHPPLPSHRLPSLTDDSQIYSTSPLWPLTKGRATAKRLGHCLRKALEFLQSLNHNLTCPSHPIGDLVVDHVTFVPTCESKRMNWENSRIIKVIRHSESLGLSRMTHLMSSQQS